MTAAGLITGIRAKVRARLITWRAMTMSRWWTCRSSCAAFVARRSNILEVGSWLLGAAISLIAQPLFRALLPAMSDSRVDAIQTLCGTIGGAMIGATAIASSFILFAMQVNVERLPHGLFRRFSTDAPLISAFAVAFLIAAFATTLSLADDPDSVALVLSSAAWSVVIILRLLFYAYRRSLQLISPYEQLKLIRIDTAKEGQRWERRIACFGPLIDLHREKHAEDQHDQTASQLDRNRAAILQANPHWSKNLSSALDSSLSYARKAAESGDEEVSAAALETLIDLNRQYIQAKGRTFIGSVPLLPDTHQTDGLVNKTLENLKLLCRAAVARTDETQIEQIFRTFLQLIRLYTTIEYVGLRAPKTHAALATGYLDRAIKSVVPLHLADPLMLGANALSDAGAYFLLAGHADEIPAIADKLFFLGGTAVAFPDDRPVTLAAMRGLENLTINLLVTDSADISLAARSLHRAAATIATLFLQIPDSPLVNSHSTFLGPIYSSTSQASLRGRLTQLVNAVIDSQIDPDQAQLVLRNLESWAEEIYKEAKQLLLLAVEKRSHFTFDMLHWIFGVAELLTAAAGADACPEYASDKLRKHANWLVSSFFLD